MFCSVSSKKKKKTNMFCSVTFVAKLGCMACWSNISEHCTYSKVMWSVKC